MMKKRGFLKVYLFIALAFGILGLIDSILATIKISSDIYSTILVPLTFLFFLFNIVVIPVFHQHRIERIAYVLPIYHLASYILFFGLGLWLGIAELLTSFWIILIIIGSLTSLFEIGFSSYLLKKFGFV